MVGTLALLAIGLAGCDSNRSPAAPSQPPPPTVNGAPPPTQVGILISGTVYDTSYHYMAGARIEVIDGPQAGMSTETDPWGEFALTGVFDLTTRFVATRDGHLPATSTLNLVCA